MCDRETEDQTDRAPSAGVVPRSCSFADTGTRAIDRSPPHPIGLKAEVPEEGARLFRAWIQEKVCQIDNKGIVQVVYSHPDRCNLQVRANLIESEIEDLRSSLTAAVSFWRSQVEIPF